MKNKRGTAMRETYIGIHAGYSDIHIQCGQAENEGEAFEGMERNDTNLIILTQKQFEQLKSLDIKSLAKTGKMVCLEGE